MVIFTKRLAAARQKSVDGAHPAAEGGGDFGVGKVVDVAKRERHALSLRQSREGFDQSVPRGELGVDVVVRDRPK